MNIVILYTLASLVVGFLLCVIAGKSRAWLLQAAYVAVLLSCLVTAAKLAPIQGTVVVSVAIGLYSMSFLLTDYLGEVYGKKEALKAVLMAVVAALILVFAIKFSIWATPAEYYQDQDAFAQILGTAPRILIASIAAFVVAQLVDVHIFDWLKAKTEGRYLALRNNVSTFAGQTLDTVIFYTIAFIGVVPNILELIIVTCIVKYLIAAIDTPFLYLAKRIANSKSS